MHLSGSGSRKFKPRNVSIGDPCDPYLWRFAKRQFDEARPERKNWLRNILGKPWKRKDVDFEYHGKCDYLCPGVLCISVYSKNGFLLADVTKFDCVTIDERDPYKGVCTCGHQWSLVDPLSMVLKAGGNSMIKYHSPKGFDRRLLWDADRYRCAAAEYGHCSYQWEGDFGKYYAEGHEFQTFCYDPQQRCVNRSVTHLGVVYKPMKIKRPEPDDKVFHEITPRVTWYGVCAKVDRIQNPFSGEARIVVGYDKGLMISLQVIFFYLIV